MLLIRRTSLALLVFALLGFIGCRTEAQRAKIAELHRLAAETPKFADFQQVRYDELSKPGMALVTYYYETASRHENVRDFYLKELVTRGWTREPQENWLGPIDNPLTFRKGNYKIIVTHDELLSQYSIDFSWKE